VGMFTLAAMCYDRYEALAKTITLERMFTVVRAKSFVVAIWIIIISMTFCVQTGHILTMKKNGGICFSMQAPPYNMLVLHETLFTGYALIVMTSIWMKVCFFIYLRTLSKVHQRIRHHMEEMSNVLGTRRVEIEINLYKISIVIIFVYSVLWIPFGVSRGLYSSLKFRVYGIACFYAMGYQLSYVAFGVLPYIYIFSDKMARKRFRGMFRRHNQVNNVSD